MKNKIFLIIIALFTLFLSCTDKFLNLPSYGQQTPEDYFSSSSSSAEEIVNATYNALLQFNMHGFPWLGVASITSDDASKGSSPGDLGTDKLELNNFTFNSEAVSFDNVWEANYVGIIRANYALEQLPALDIESTLKNRLIGEASFLRAYFYWNLVRCFGGVPLITFVPIPNDAAQQDMARKRASEDDIYNLIIEDLIAAELYLPEKSTYGIRDIGRASLGAARAFLAKVYLYKKNWAEVERLTKLVINSSEYDLNPDYAQIWREKGENTFGSIFEVQCRGLTPNIAIEGFTEVQSIRGMFGWGFNTPTQNLYDAYTAGDLRKNAVFIQAGQTLWDDVVVNSVLENKFYNYKAYISETKETFNGDRWKTNKNYRFLRLADVYLMLCEALFNINPSDADIFTYLNLVRVRAGLSSVSSTDFANSTALRDEILLQRRLELAMENDRFFDLIRQGRTYDSNIPIKALGTDTNPDSEFSWEKNQVFPIPKKQIQLSGGKLIQNPNYN